MYCVKCGEKLAENSNFCSVCGTSVVKEDTKPEHSSAVTEKQKETPQKDRAQEQSPPTPKAAETPPENPSIKPKTIREKEPWSKKKKLMVLIPCAAFLALCIAAAVIIPITLNNRYNDAVSAMNNGNPEDAKAEFLKIKIYKDSDELAQTCQDMIEYAEAVKKMNNGDYSGAQSGFLSLGEYEDSSALAAECENMIDYLAAVDKMNRGDYAIAKSDFLALEGYKDSAALAAECQKIMEYETAIVLMDMGEYAIALDSFIKIGNFYDSVSLALECQNKLRYFDAVSMMEEGRFQDALNEFKDIGDIWDSEDLAVVCRDNVYYIEADTAFSEGRYFDAYYMFLTLDEFMDAQERAKECIQEVPKASELFRNGDFSSKKVAITIIGPAQEYNYNTFIKIYSSNGELVSSLFIPVGGKLKIGLPSGTYQFKVGYGGDWFGPIDAFGDFGEYQILLFNNGEETWTIKSNYSYTLTLITQEGGNIGGRNENPDDF